jgi:hypothetical protein
MEAAALFSLLRKTVSLKSESLLLNGTVLRGEVKELSVFMLSLYVCCRTDSLNLMQYKGALQSPPMKLKTPVFYAHHSLKRLYC